MFKKIVSNSKRGFTLIEITVVVGIIVVLVTIAVVAGSSAKSLARDNQRKTDIRLLQVKLEAYREMNGVYPTSLNTPSDTHSLVSSGIISDAVLPKDPINSGVNQYQYFPLKFSTGNCTTGSVSYYLYATLENNNSDVNTGTNINFSTSPVNGLLLCSGTLPTFSSKTYDVTSPK